MEFLNDKTADIVQLVSLPLEILGGVLTFLEIIKPDKADELEKYVDLLEARLNKPWEYFVKSKTTDRVMSSLGERTLSLEMSVIYIYIIVIQVLPHQYHSFVKSISLIYILSMAAPLMVMILVLLSTWAIAQIFRFFRLILELLNSVSNGRAIGSIGLILAGLGICGELYQVMNLFYGSSTHLRN